MGTQRARIVSGEDEPSQEQIAEAEKLYEEEQRKQREEEEEEDEGVTIEEIPDQEGADQQIDSKQEADKKEEEDDDKQEEEADTKGVPDFWLVVLKNNAIFADIVTEKDEKALAFLQEIVSIPSDGVSTGYI